MKKSGLLLFVILALGAIVGSCSNKETKETKEENVIEPEELSLSLPTTDSSWRLIDYVGADGSVNEVPKDVVCILRFNGKEHLFGLSTDCNGMGGEYKTEGDSIKFENIAQTLMACPSMVIEQAMHALLPRIDTYAINPDSILRLRSDMRIVATLVMTNDEAENELDQE